MGAGGSVWMLLLQVFVGTTTPLSLHHRARGRVGHHATIYPPSALFPKSRSPKVVHLSSHI